MTGFSDSAITSDRLLGGRLVLEQPAAGYRAAIDPVLLAAAVPAVAGDRVLDLGCGIGTAALCLARRCSDAALVGIELQEILVEMALRNVQANGLSARVRFRRGDVRDETVDGAPFDHVMANPPYLERGRASISPNSIKAMANVEGEARLADWVAAAIRAVRQGGSVTFIHRADRGQELRQLMARGLGRLWQCDLVPRADAVPKRIILQGVKGAATEAGTTVTLVLHEADGRFTPAAEAILRDAAPLRPDPVTA
jgi:tRNA1(Val) A37 N6-methylase TrmN6